MFTGQPHGHWPWLETTSTFLELWHAEGVIPRCLRNRAALEKPFCFTTKGRQRRMSTLELLPRDLMWTLRRCTHQPLAPTRWLVTSLVTYHHLPCAHGAFGFVCGLLLRTVFLLCASPPLIIISHVLTMCSCLYLSLTSLSLFPLRHVWRSHQETLPENGTLLWIFSALIVLESIMIHLCNVSSPNISTCTSQGS